MPEPNTVKLEPCPRCRSPFVETQDAGRSPEHPYTTFRCAVCMLELSVPLSVGDAVRMWNEWDRRDSVMVAAQGTADMARAHALDTAAKPTRLERLVVAQISTGRWLIEASVPTPQTVEELAEGYVRLARAIELEMDKRP